MKPSLGFHRISSGKKLGIAVVVGLAMVTTIGVLNRMGDDKPTRAEIRNGAYAACYTAVNGDYPLLDLKDDSTAAVTSNGHGDFTVELGVGSCDVFHHDDKYEVTNTLRDCPGSC